MPKVYQRQPQLFLRLAEKALVVAESFRDNYLKNTARFVSALRRTMHDAAQGKRDKPVLKVHEVENAGKLPVGR